MTREFILNTLLPYRQDRSNCAGSDLGCQYLTIEGKKCAVGKHLIDGPHQFLQSDVIALNEKYKLDTILTEEAKAQNIPLSVWKSMQLYHDGIALERPFGLNEIVETLEEQTGFEFPELKF